MFDFVRKHNRVMQFLLFLLIVPSFLLFGVEGYNRFNDKGAPVAKVDGRDIGQTEWDNAVKREVDRMREARPDIDVRLFDTPEQRYASLERLVRDRVLAAAAEHMRLGMSDGRLKAMLAADRSLDPFYDANGRLDTRKFVEATGQSPEQFRAGLMADHNSRQVLVGVAATGIALPAQAAPSLDAFLEKREIQVARFNPADYAAKVSPTDAEIEAFYTANPQLFQAPEQARIEYLVLDLDALSKDVTVKDEDVQGHIRQNAKKFNDGEERRASHILVAVPKSATPEQRAAAKAKADQLLAGARAKPDTFAQLAKQSDDPASGAKGGDLDWSGRGAFVSPKLEEAVFALKKGDVGDQLVESEYGYHVVKLVDIKPGTRSRESIRAEAEADVKKQLAQRKFADSADAFNNAVYEASDGLKSVAERFKLEVKTASGITRKPEAGAKGVLANPKLLAALFSPDSIEKKRNTEAVETGPNQLVSARLVEYAPARALPLAEIKDKVKAALVTARSTELARKDGADKLAAWKANPASASLPEPVAVSREETQKQPSPVIEAALRADPSALPVFAGVDLGSQGYAVVKVAKTLPRAAATGDAAKQDSQQYAQWWTAAESLAYYNLLKERYKVKILAPKPAPKVE